jgi:indole-3-glycerol phosphate synthase
VTLGFLREILAENRECTERGNYLEGLPAVGPGQRSSLKAAIAAQTARGAVLAEFKRVSPGQASPVLPTHSVVQFVRDAERADVAGFSCLATSPRFEGSPRDVEEVARIGRRPVLFKDFVVSDRQLDAAQRSGASAVLLIARLVREGLGKDTLGQLADSAHRRGLEVLLEFHAEAELSEANGVAADMFGVNVRDLDSLRIDRGAADATLRVARTAGLRPMLGLSGVESPTDAAWFWERGADGILVGSAVARSERPVEFLQSLRRLQSGHRP